MDANPPNTKFQTCPKCGADITLRNKKDGGYFLSCLSYPNCKAVTWLPSTVKGLQVTDETCDAVSIKHSGEIRYKRICCVSSRQSSIFFHFLINSLINYLCPKFTKNIWNSPLPAYGFFIFSPLIEGLLTQAL